MPIPSVVEQFALDLASIGIRVFARKSVSREDRVDWIQIPAGCSALNASTSDQELIKQLAKSDASTFGVVCGPTNKLLVFDVESPSHKNVPADNLDRFWEWWAKHTPDQYETTIVHTKSDGLHVWMRLPEGCQLPHRNEIDGIVLEVFADDKRSVPLPGTRVGPNGGGYSFQNKSEIRSIPAEMLEYLSTINRHNQERDADTGKVREGKRHDYVVREIIKLRKAGVSDDVLDATAQELYKKTTDGPHTAETEREVSKAVKWAIKNTPAKEKVKDALVRLALEHSVELWHAPELDCYATVEIDGHRENCRIESKDYRNYLSKIYFDEIESAPGTSAVNDALAVIRGKARFSGACHPVYVRLAPGKNGDVWFDLGTEDWQVVHIFAGGWDLTYEPAVRFIRGSGMLPLPEPSRGGNFDRLREFVNIGDNEAWELIRMFLIGVMRPGYPCPALVLEGPQGSAKSTTQRAIRNLIDPNIASVRSQPRREEDLVIAAINGAVVSIDNLSSIPDWLSDALCRLTTGGGLSKRKLYTDLDETLVEVQRPLMMNGISDFLTRSDLVDRLIILVLPALSEANYRDERKAKQQFDLLHGEILGGLLDLTAGVLGEVDHVEEHDLPRMADFGITILALERVLKMETGSLLNIYRNNRDEASMRMIESSVFIDEVAEYILDTQNPMPETMTPSEWLNVFTSNAPESKTKSKQWPKDARTLSQYLNRFAPNLQKAGIQFESFKWGQKRAISFDRSKP